MSETAPAAHVFPLVPSAPWAERGEGGERGRCLQRFAKSLPSTRFVTLARPRDENTGREHAQPLPLSPPSPRNAGRGGSFIFNSARRFLSTASLLLALLLSPISPSLATEPPRKIVSLNLCTDQLLFDLVPRERIAGLSWVASDRNVSAIADQIGAIRLLRGTAEEVLALDPDLVLAGAYTTVATVDLLRRLGRRVEVIELAQDIEAVRRTIRQVAAAIGENARGEAMIVDFDSKLAALPAPPAGQRPTALAYQVSGLVSTTGSLLDAVLTRVGFANKAGDYRLGRAGDVALEMLVADPADLLILAHAPGTYRTVVAENLRHPALQRLLAERPHVVLDMPAWLCGTQRIATAAADLAAARAKLGATRTDR